MKESTQFNQNDPKDTVEKLVVDILHALDDELKKIVMLNRSNHSFAEISNIILAATQSFNAQWIGKTMQDVKDGYKKEFINDNIEIFNSYMNILLNKINE